MKKVLLIILIAIAILLAVSTLQVKVYFNEFKNNYLVEIEVFHVRIFREIKDLEYVNEFEDIEEFNLKGVI